MHLEGPGGRYHTRQGNDARSLELGLRGALKPKQKEFTKEYLGISVFQDPKHRILT